MAIFGARQMMRQLRKTRIFLAGLSWCYGAGCLILEPCVAAISRSSCSKRRASEPSFGRRVSEKQRTRSTQRVLSKEICIDDNPNLPQSRPTSKGMPAQQSAEWRAAHGAAIAGPCEGPPSTEQELKLPMKAAWTLGKPLQRKHIAFWHDCNTSVLDAALQSSELTSTMYVSHKV